MRFINVCALNNFQRFYRLLFIRFLKGDIFMKKIIALFLTIVFLSANVILSFAEISGGYYNEDTVALTNNDSVDLAAQSFNTSILAFPGAEGAGKYATGGRGGKVYHVTNLNDSGTGSFRDAVSGSNRIVVFDVGGTIELKSDVVIKGNVTIEGQTAPGGAGVTLKNYKLGLGGDNIIIRYISSRPGPENDENCDYDGWGGDNGSVSMIDHCSTGWATDEQYALYSNNMYQTVQWSVIGPADSWGGHKKGAHGYAIMFGKGQNSWHHNMIAHNLSRNYRGKVEGTYVMDYVNNVIYDWGEKTAYGTHGHINYVNNYFKAGNSTYFKDAKDNAYRYFTLDGSDRKNYRFYLNGNKIVHKDGSVYNDDNSADGNWNDSVIDYSTTLNNSAVLDSNKNMLQKGYCKVDKPMPIYEIDHTELNERKKTVYVPKKSGKDFSVLASESYHLDTADEAFNNVIAYAGAGINADSRTPIDAQVMKDAKEGTGCLTGTASASSADSIVKGKIDKYKIQCDTKYTYPDPVLKKEIVDEDKDGMADDWEIERGLDPNNPSDAIGDYLGQGYNNIEYYCNDLTVDSFPPGVVKPTSSIKNYVTVDSSAEEVEGDTYKTFAKAMEYVKNNYKDKDRRIIYVAKGEYNETMSIDMDNVSVMPPKDKNTQEAIIFNGINISKDAVNVSVEGINFYGDSSGPVVSVSGDKAVFKECNIEGNSLAVSLNNKARAYFKTCNIDGSVFGDAQAVFNDCSISSNDVIAKSSISSTDKYGLLFMNSTISGDSILASTILGAPDGEYGQIVYYNCEMRYIDNKRFEDVTGKTEKIRFIECKTKILNDDKTMTDLVNVPEYEKIIDENEFLETYGAFKHLKGNDGWNPDSFDEVTPKEKFLKLADSISVPKGLITVNTDLIDSFSSDENVNVTWSASDSSALNGNTIVIGNYGEGVKYITLTAVVSKDGFEPVTKKFDNVAVASSTDDSNVIVDFEDGDSTKIEISKEQTDAIKWGVVDRDDKKGKAYHINQTASTGETKEGIYNFDYKFDKKSEKVIEVDFDALGGEITPGSYFEIYLRGDETIGQIRFGDDNIEAFKNPTEKAKLSGDASKWYKFKMIVSTEGITNGESPKADYYIFDEDGSQIGSCLNALPAKDFTTVEDKGRFIPSKIEFRPNRKMSNCEFYIDNIQFKDLTDIAKQDADALGNTQYIMNVGDRLPEYGNHMSKIEWMTVEGQDNVINSDGTINYNNCGDTSVTVKGIVSCGENLKGIAETKNIVISVKGSGQNEEIVYDKFFEDTDDFAKWRVEYNQTKPEIANKETVNGNSSVKIKLPDKAVFKTFNTPAATGKINFETDFMADSSGRTFRIFFENNETANNNGFGTEAFSKDNIFYHLTDIGGKTYVITSDSPDAKNLSDTLIKSSELCAFEPGKWYRIKIDVDFDSKTAVTSAYLHGTDGSYNTENISSSPVGKVTSNLISKTPLRLKQIRLVKTADGNIYFDNISVKDGNESSEEDLYYGNVDGDNDIDAQDATLTLRYVLEGKTDGIAEDGVERMKVMGNDYVTANDAAAILRKARDGGFKFKAKK